MLSRHILFISQAFAPWGGPGGMRATKLAKQSLARDIPATVLTTSEDCRHNFDDPNLLSEVVGVKTIRVSDGTNYPGRRFLSKALGYQGTRVLDKLLSKTRERWAKDCIESAKQHFSNQPPTLIYATPPVHEVVSIADELAAAWGVPYIMDFRDPPWEIGMAPECLGKYLESCRLASFNTPPAAERVRQENPIHSAKIECWTNGVELPPQQLPLSETPFESRDILFGGGIYPWVVDSLKALKPMADSCNLGLNVYGFLEPKRDAEINEIKRMGANFNPPVPSATMIKMMGKCWANLVTLPPEYQISSKLYLTIASGRPVLIYGRSKSSDALLPGVPGIFHFDQDSTPEELAKIEKQISDYDMHSEWPDRFEWLKSRSWPYIFDGIFNRFFD